MHYKPKNINQKLKVLNPNRQPQTMRMHRWCDVYQTILRLPFALYQNVLRLRRWWMEVGCVLRKTAVASVATSASWINSRCVREGEFVCVCVRERDRDREGVCV